MKSIKLILVAIILCKVSVSCNSDADDLGVNFFDGNSAVGVQSTYDMVAYNVDNGDRIRSDVFPLNKVVLGVFSESHFGMQKSSYVTQVRLSSYSPDFGTNPIVDSVVLEFKPSYDETKLNTSVKNITYDGVEAVQTLTSYDVVKYGNESNNITINVNEINTDLGSVGDVVYSDKEIVKGRLIGSKTFSGKTIAVKTVKSSDNTVLQDKSAGVRILLDNNYFQSKIVSKAKATELSSESSFVSYFKGLKISVQENDGYIMYFTPDDVKVTIHYTSGETANRMSSSYSLDVSTSNNVNFSKVTYDRTNEYKNIISNINVNSGDSKLYLQGMGGAGVGIKLEGHSIESLKKLYKEQGAVILSAKIRMYVDGMWNNLYTKPTNFLVKRVGDEDDLISDITTMYYNSNYSLVSLYTSDNSMYYDVDITKTIKDIVEKGAESTKDIIINVGNYNRSSDGSFLLDGVSFPHRVILVGTDNANDKSVKLLVTYIASKKS